MITKENFKKYQMLKNRKQQPETMQRQFVRSDQSWAWRSACSWLYLY